MLKVRRAWIGLVAGLLLAAPASAGLTLKEICDAKGPIRVTSVDTNTFTGEEVLSHMPGPTAQDFGDFLIGTADDGIHPGLTLPPQPGFSPIFGCPNDLMGQSAIPSITCGVPGAPGTKLLHGTAPRTSQESGLHTPDSDQLNMAIPGHGSYSFIVATVGRFQSLSYLTGTFTAMLTGFDGTFAEVQVANLTLGGTTLAPNVLFKGPFNADLITVGPGDDLKYHAIKDDETGETVVRGCNGLAPGVDGVDNWFPTSEGPFPKFPNINRSNRGRWNLVSNPEKGGRLITSTADNLTKVPTSQGFFVTQDVGVAGYLFPIDEAEALLFSVFRPDAENLDDLPDLPGFPGSGRKLARYFVEVMTPMARENRDNRIVGFLRATATVKIIGIDTFLDITIVGAGDFGEFDICTLDVKPCTF